MLVQYNTSNECQYGFYIRFSSLFNFKGTTTTLQLESYSIKYTIWNMYHFFLFTTQGLWLRRWCGTWPAPFITSSSEHVLMLARDHHPMWWKWCSIPVSGHVMDATRHHPSVSWPHIYYCTISVASFHGLRVGAVRFRWAHYIL